MAKINSDLDEAVSHENGHAIYALAAGANTVLVQIFQNPVFEAAARDGSPFDGTLHRIILGRHSHLPLNPLIEAAACGFAGVIGEYQYIGMTDEKTDREIWDLVHRPNAMSNSDIAATNSAGTEDATRWEAFQKALSTLRNFRDSHREYTKSMKGHFVHEGMVHQNYPMVSPVFPRDR